MVTAAPVDDPIEVPRARGVYCNRTLNFRALGAIGYDMDYTLVQYRVAEWESEAFVCAKQKLAEQGFPVGELAFDLEQMIQGLILDTELGNLLKVNRFGYVKQACHGTRHLTFEEQRERYSRTIVDHREERYVFMSTLFSLSESSLFSQLVDLWDAGQLPAVRDYADLYAKVRRAIDRVHGDGELKRAIVENPDRFIDVDPDTPLALIDQRKSGKKLLLITNSEWPYTRRVMAHAFDSRLPGEMAWRDLFDLVIVSARKPDFFTSRSPMLEVVDDEGLLRPLDAPLESGRVYFGGNADMVERYLGLPSDRILYVGDHFFGDVHASKKMLRWRTALVVRELEDEIRAAEDFEPQRKELVTLMAEKTALEHRYSHARLRLQNASAAPDALRDEVVTLRAGLAALDERITPLAQASAALGNRNWGPLFRAGNDKSYLAWLVEFHADIYTSRVSNFRFQTPYRYYRSVRGTFPHD